MKKSELKDRRYRCNICNKNYSSASSLWNHNNKFHNDNVVILGKNEVILGNNEVIINNKQCKFCNKILNDRSYKYKHEKKCKIKNCDKKNKIDNEIKKLKILKKSITNNTTNNNNITNNNNTTNNTTNNNNNGTINNITINAFTKEKIFKFPVKELKKFIRNDNYLYNIIEYINFNKKYPENHSFCSTSLEGKYISLLNPETNVIEKVSKDRFLEKVYENANEKIEAILFEFDINKEFREQFGEKYINHLQTKYKHTYDLFMKNNIHKKKYKLDINQLSYNKKNLIQDTWSKIEKLDIIDEISEEYFSDSTLSSEKKYDSETDTDSDDITNLLNI
jgi:hypothetical protein